MNKTKYEHNFDVRTQFGQLDGAILLTPIQVGQVIGASSVGAVYTSLYRGDLPEPLIRRNRQIRWSVGQLREHIRMQMDELRTRQAAQTAGGQGVTTANGKRRGRPRKNAIENPATA